MVREDGIHRTEVHVAGLCVKQTESGELLLLAGKRTKHRDLFPGDWECGGGQVEEGEDFETAIKRQIKQEFDIDVSPEFPIHVYYIEDNGSVIPGLRFICTMETEDQEVTIDEREFVTYEWIPVSELDQYSFIPGLRSDIEESLSRYRELQQ
ncbi:MAG: NUDIX domain-containing protein [Halobacteriaceae archaeon]